MEEHLYDFYNRGLGRTVLASGSPRRRELLRQAGLADFTVLPVDADEHVPDGTPPHTMVMLLAERKAAAAAERCEDNDVIIAADTIVWVDGVILGKPHTEERARDMLKLLSGRAHSVFSGVTVRRGDLTVTDYEETRVFFRDLEPEEIEAYLRTGEALDKAGAYAVQGAACTFVRRIEGDYYNVVGLPLAKLWGMLKIFGVKA